MTAALLLAALAASGPPGLQAVLDEYRESQDVPGVSAVVVRQNEVFFTGASGVTDLETARPMTADSVFYMGSLSKVLTAVLVLQLVEAGQLSLEDTVDGIGARAAASTPPVSVAHLLTHSSGLQREGDFGYWFTADFPGSTDLSQYLSNAELRFAPGTAMHYSNVGYAALGFVIEQTDNQSYSDALRTRVLEPLSMSASGAHGPAEGVANGYTPPNHILPGPERPFAGIGKKVANRHVRMYHDARAMSPAFGAYSSANDLGRLARFLLGQKGDEVLSRAMRSRMHERQASGWGLGLKIRRLAGRKVARHDGWFAAHRTHLLLDVDNGIGVVVMANSDNATPGKIADALLEAALESDTGLSSAH
jgi:CubicO group peptidase (beta-lactamase class C family)